MNTVIELKFIKYLMNLKALNYLKENKMIDSKTYEKSILQIREIAQS